jgi:predicted nucleotidyltransferase component of viral defense system
LEILSLSLFAKDYTLVGGTALSLQIKHRLSEDLNLIYDGETLNLSTIKRNISKLFPNYRIIKQDENYQIDFIIDGVKVTFFSTGAIQIPFKVKSYTTKFNNINIAVLKIIGVLKLSAIAERNVIRDYYDLYFLIKYHFSLIEIINTTKELLPNLSPVTYTSTIIYTDDLLENDISEHLIPKEIVSKKEISDFFVQELRKIKHLL